MVHDTGDGRRRKCDKARMYSSPGSCLANPLEEKQAGNLHNVAHIQYTAYIYIYNGILCKTTQVEMHKYNGRLALQRENIRENVGATNRNLAAISGSSSCLPAKINRCLGGKTPWSHLSNCTSRYFACAKYLIRRNAFFVLNFCLNGPTHCRIPMFATSLCC